MKSHTRPSALILGLCAALMLAVASPARGAVGTIMLVVVNSSSLTTQETAKKTLMEGWGYTVTPISASASQATFDTALLTTSAAYVTCGITAATLSTKLVSTPVPVINEVDALSDEFGFSSAATTINTTAIDITNTAHYITSAFSSGSLAVFSTNQKMRYTSGTVAAYTVLAERLSSSNAVLGVFERGDAMTPSGSAAGRRVQLPWGDPTLDITKLTTNGQTLMQRAIEWALLPICHWKLDDASGATAVDSNSARNGTLTSGPTWTTGKLVGGLSFDGNNDYITIADHTHFKPTMALTVAAWIKGDTWNSGSEVNIVLRKGDDNPNNWEFCVSDNGNVELILDAGDNDGSGAKGSTTLATNRWYHIAGTWDGAKMRVYVNGVLDNTPKTYASAIGTDTRAIYIGGRTGSTDVHDGILDDVRFYNRCLTQPEILDLVGVSAPKIVGWQAAAP